MKIVLFLVCLTSWSQLFSQTVSGKIVDQNNEPLENVNVYFKKYHTGTVSDRNGFFSLKTHELLKENDTIHFSLLGYSTTSIALLDFNFRENFVVLTEKTEALNEVIIERYGKLKDKLKFTKLTSMHHAVFGFGSIIKNNKVYILGGNELVQTDVGKKAVIMSNGLISGLQDFAKLTKRYAEKSTHGFSDKLQVYDFKTERWLENKIELNNRAYHNLNYYDGSLYAIGGKQMSTNGIFESLNNKVESINIDSLVVRIDKTNPHQSVNFTSAVYNNYLIVLGGSYKKNATAPISYIDKVHIYNFKTGLWYELTEMLNPKEVSGTLLGDKIYLFGGYKDKVLSDIEVFNLIDGSWKTIGNLPIPMKRPALAVKGNDVYIYERGNMLVFDTRTKDISKFHINLQLKEASLHFYNDALYIVGGYEETIYSKKASPNIYEIKLSDFFKTKYTVQKLD
ncbi:Kelch repeat-containing protein [Pseudotamlana agarivorans]|uniref:Kelch repeat-containing protein n=1 Tax=Pseudotamlana agarivorans TaxID=481183 RepID=UPI000830F986|nr:kelch repeat-containing protein [Tamlana agarivorans]